MTHLIEPMYNCVRGLVGDAQSQVGGYGSTHTHPLVCCPSSSETAPNMKRDGTASGVYLAEDF